MGFNTILKIDFVDGILIETACKEAIELANRLQTNIEFNFNGVYLFAIPKNCPTKLVDYYHKALNSNYRAE